MSEWKPFMTSELRGHKVNDIAVSMQKTGEKVELWPYDCMRKTLIVAIYASSFFSPLKLQPEGFLIIDKKGEIADDSEFCKKVVRDFWIWHRIYFRPPVKYIFFKKRYFSMLKQRLQSSFENCKNRYENNLYRNDDPAKKRYNDILKELDLQVINSNSLFLKIWNLMEEIIDLEKAIWQRCSCEKIDRLEKLLIEYKLNCSKMAEYTSKRAETFYLYEKAIKDAYKIDLQFSHYSILSKAALSFLLWLASTNLYALAIPFLPELLKLCYQTFMGYKSLLRKSKQYLEKTVEIVSLLDLFYKPVDISKIRN